MLEACNVSFEMNVGWKITRIRTWKDYTMITVCVCLKDCINDCECPKRTPKYVHPPVYFHWNNAIKEISNNHHCMVRVNKITSAGGRLDWNGVGMILEVWKEEEET